MEIYSTSDGFADDRLRACGRSRNDRAENSHQPTRRRERVYNTFNVQRHVTSAEAHRTLRAAAIDTWRTAVAAA
jgi:putative transposase